MHAALIVATPLKLYLIVTELYPFSKKDTLYQQILKITKIYIK